MFKRYAYSGNSGKANTFIGGVASTIGTKYLLATKLGINAARITNFEVRGSDIRCCIIGKYELPQGVFRSETSQQPITYYDDKDGLSFLNNAPGLMFRFCVSVRHLNFPNANILQGSVLQGTTNLRILRLKSATGIYPQGTLYGQMFENVQNCKLYLPSVQSLGDANIKNGFFYNLKNSTIYIHPSQQTCNAGAPNPDLIFDPALNNTVVYVQNKSAPARITNLTIGAITTTTIALNFTAPSSVNTIEKYEVEIDGVWYQDINGPGDSITGLVSATKYKNITVKARDIYYNRTEEESNKILEVETSAIVIDIVSDFKTRVLADGGTFENETALRVFAETLVIGNTTLALAPSSFKAGKIYSVLPNTGGGDATVTRATTKTRINSSGILETLDNNVLAPDYSTGIGRILVEQQRTNFYSTSENFASGWTKSNLSTTANTSLSPYGTMTASTVKESVDASVIQHRMFRILAVTSGKNYTFSIFARARDRSFIRMQPSAGFNNAYANFDLVNGVVGLTDGGNPRIYSLANGLKRIAITVTANTTGNVYPSSFITIDGDNASQNYVGTGLDCYDIFGAMVVEGEEMGSYIPSLGSMVTRNADIVTITPPALTAKIIESLDNGAVNTVTTIPSSYQVPFGRYKSIAMTK